MQTIDSIRQNGFSQEKQISLFHELENNNRTNREDSLHHAFVHYYLGNRYNRINQFTSSIFHSIQAVDLFTQLGHKNYQRAYAISKLGDAYFNNGEINKALETYSRLEKLDLKGREFNALANGSRISAAIYRNRSDNESAIRILEYTKQFKDSISQLDMTQLLLELAINYSEMNQLENAQLALNESIQSNPNSNPLHEINQQELLANLKLRAKEFDEAIKLYEATFKELETIDISENKHEYIARILSNSSFNLRIAGQLNESLDMSIKALHTYNQSGKKQISDALVVILDNLSMSYFELSKIDSAQHYNSIAIAQINNSGQPEFTFRKRLIDLYNNKSKINYLRYKATDEKIHLQNSIEDLLRMDNLFDQFIRDNISEQSALNIKSEFLGNYRRAVDIAFEGADVASFWLFSEKTKGIILLDALNKNIEADDSSQGLIRSLASEEINLNLLLNNKSLSNLEKDSIELMITDIRKQQLDIKKSQFSEGKNTSIEYISIPSIQKQLDKDNIIHYQYGEQHIYGIMVTANDYQLQKLGDRDSLDMQIKNYSNLVRAKSTHAQTIKKLNQLAYYLYEKLIAPFTPTAGSLIIIPDDNINYLPFESLITTHEPSLKPSYLIYDHPLQYAISAKLFYHLKKQESSIPIVNVINPSYEITRGNHHSSGLTLLPLVYAEQEVKNIGHYFKTKHIISKGDFFSALQSTDLIHFSGHAVLDTANNNWSYLALSNSNDQSEKITLAELYNQQSNSPLVVLSACETGSGKLIKGEGVSSITRGLLYSGVQSVLNTLWSVNDQTTSKVISHFYAYLDQGMRKSEALQQAKIDYLNTAADELKHPYYWSSIISNGNDSPVRIKRQNNLKLLILSLGVCIAVMLIFFRLKR